MAKTGGERVALYARVSTDMQAEGGKSIPAQLNEMRDFAAARGWTIVSEFVDPGFSGTDMDRPGLHALLAAAEERAYDILLVHELSRLSRRIFDTFRIFEQVGKLGIGFASVKEPDFDFSTPTGRLFLTIMAALNQYYVDLLKMHTAKSKRQRAREGLYNASITPYGYSHVGDSNTPPVIVKKEAAAVLKMYKRYATGKHSYDDVAQWISDAGYRTRSGRRFSKDTVADILRNPFYRGYVAYRAGSRNQDAAEVFPGKHEAIVTSDLWEKCRQVREQRRGAPRTYQPKYRVYLLNGIATCDVCGRKLRAQGAASGLYYREMSSHRGFMDCPFGRTGVRTNVVDGQIGAIFRRLQLPENWRARLAKLVEEGDDDQQTLERRRARLVAERRRVKQMKIAGEFDDDPALYTQELSRIRRQLTELPTPADLEAVERAATMLKELTEVWDEAEPADRRDLLRLAVREVKVDVPQGRVATVEPYPIFVPLFRQIPLVREVAFGVFVPLWTPDLAEELRTMTVLLPPLTVAPGREESPAWPLVPALPEEVVGQRITPVLSAWLKEHRQRSVGGVVVDLARPGVPHLRVDGRKWPDVEVESVGQLRDLKDGTVSFLWTPFALQAADDRPVLIEEVQRVLELGGTWAFVDVLPNAMPGHWLYRFFPQAWENDRGQTWDASRVFNVLRGAGFQVELKRRTVYQAIEIEMALQIASRREECRQLESLPAQVYARELEALEQQVGRDGKECLVGSEFCLLEVVATWEGTMGESAG
jgi:DNA invertase Pin-like site-specific DNA recombinase